MSLECHKDDTKIQHYLHTLYNISLQYYTYYFNITLRLHILQQYHNNTT